MAQKRTVFGARQLYIFPPFPPFWEGGTFIINSHFGRFQRPVFLLFSAILIVFGRRYFFLSFYFWPLWRFLEGVGFIT